MNKIFKTFLLQSNYGDEILSERYFYEKDKALEYINILMDIGANVIRDNCNYYNLEWIKTPKEDINSNENILEKYHVFYEWEKHDKGCPRNGNYTKDCTCKYSRKLNNLYEYTYEIIVQEIDVY